MSLTTDLLACTVPVVHRARRNGRPIPAGTGLLLRIGDSSFVLTAAHVFDHASDRIGVGLGSQIVPLGFRWRSTSHTSSSDLVDVAVAFLEGLPNLPEDCRFLTLADLDPIERSSDRQRETAYLALGFPDKKQRFYDGRYVPKADHFLANLTAIDEHHIKVRYAEGDFVNSHGPVETSDPTGMSGGGLWRVASALKGVPTVSLVGILTEWDRPNQQIVATRISSILAGIYACEPAARPVIRLYFHDWVRDTVMPNVVNSANTLNP